MNQEKDRNLSATQTYSSAQPDQTQTYDNRSDATQTYDHRPAGSETTQAYDQSGESVTDKTQTHHLGKGDEIELNQKRYWIVEIVSGDQKTGEAVIYKIADDAGKIYCLKLYFYFPDPRHEPNPEALRRINAIKDPDILRLYDYGTRDRKYQHKFCFEISDFAEGGDLLRCADLKKKYTPQFLRQEVIPQIFKGIRRLHENKIFHCDLKPQNVFYLDKEQIDLVIGDYGSAKTFEESSEKELGFTSMVKGTNMYRAPEQADGIVSEKNDYYSLGMIICHLLYPGYFTTSEWRKMVQRRTIGKPIVDFDPKYEDLNTLIEGLTLMDYNHRWGKSEVERWLAGESVDVQRAHVAELIPINLGKVTIKTPSDLVGYIEKNSEWYDNLIGDEEGYRMLLSWLMSIKDLEQKNIFKRMIENYRANDNKDYVKEAILRYFQPNRPVVVEMKRYAFSDTGRFKQEVEQFFNQLDDMWKVTDNEHLKFYLFQLEFRLRQAAEANSGAVRVQIQALLDKMSAVLGASPKNDFSDFKAVLYPRIEKNPEKLLELFYAFNPQRGFKDGNNKSYHNIEEVGKFFGAREALFSDQHLQVEKRVFLHQQQRDELSKMSYNEFLFSALKNYVHSEIHFIDFRVHKADNEVIYKLGKSLADYFRRQNIDNNLSEMSKKEESLSLPGALFTSTSTIFQRIIDRIERKHQIPANLISPASKEEFLSALKDRLRQLRIQAIKTGIAKFLEVTKLPQLIKSLAFLLPLFVILLVTAACGLNQEAAFRLLGKISPFPLTMMTWGRIGTLYQINALNISLLLFLCLLPGLIITFIKRKFTISKSTQKTVLGLVIFLLINGIVYVMFSHKLVLLSLQIVAGLLGFVVGGTILIWLLKLAHLTPLLLIAGPLVMRYAGNLEGEIFSIAIMSYLIFTALMILTNVISFYQRQGKLYFLPFVLSLAFYGVLGSSVVNLKALGQIRHEAPPIRSATNYGTITSSAVNIRSAPSPNASVVGRALQGESVVILGKSGVWYHIKYQNLEGYIYQDYLRAQN
ncbi:MAG: SH3 domain-containing protein [candidate division KSB1 bacterium]|nr:SH3 domain-containing protein [candidate division KSB1 bacterium]